MDNFIGYADQENCETVGDKRNFLWLHQGGVDFFCCWSSSPKSNQIN